MRGIVLILLLAIAHADIEGFFSNGCPKDTSIEKLLPHEKCDQFYQCFHGALVARLCPSGLNFNSELEKCDWAEETKCHSKRHEEKKEPEHSEEIDITAIADAASICASTNSNGILLPHENCNEFYKCSFGKPVVLKCAQSLLYNPLNEKCDWAYKVECGDRAMSVTENPFGNAFKREKPDTVTSNDDIETGNVTSNDDVETANIDPNQAPLICAAADNDGMLVAHENCNSFYKCIAGKAVVKRCPLNLLYNANKEYCDWHRNVACGDRIIPENDDSPENDGKSNESEENDDDIGHSEPSQAPIICAAPKSNGVLVAHQFCRQFYKCSGGLPVAFHCPGSLLYNPIKSYCDWPHNVDCGDRINSSDNNEDNDYYLWAGEITSNHSDPSQARAICAVQGSDGVLVAHENCNQFYKCYEGHPVELICPGNLLYNSVKEFCDWPNYIECGSRLILVEADGNSNEDNDAGVVNRDGSVWLGKNRGDPNNAPGICAAENSDGTLIAHENCNQFYKCSEGQPVPLFCQLNLLYNPTKEYCDWPQNVYCGYRIIPNENNTNENDGSSSDIQTYSCSGSPDGNIIPHGNCSQFFKCISGKTFPMDCPPGLYFNADLKVCDWPMNVDCGDRLTESQIFNKHEVAQRALRFIVPLH